MYKSFPKRFLSIIICLILFLSSISYADTVVVGVAPGSGLNGNKIINQNASTTYLENQYSGPGILPNSSITHNSPIQVQNLNQSSGQVSAMSLSPNTSDTGPKTTNISSPGAHNQQLAATHQNAGVIANGAYSTGAVTNTSDSGPVTQEITAPVAGGESITSNNYVSEGPGTNEGNSIVSYDTEPEPMQSSTVNYTTSNDGVIIYTVNNNIRAVRPNITAPGALVVNASTRQIYYSKGGLNPFHPAALANLVTASILLTHKKLDDVLIVNASAVTGLESGAHTAKLRAGDTITVRDAIGAMFVKSCCDVANVVAENVAGNVTNFVALMNQTVKNWGCVGTNFTNPTGLNHNSQITTTYDMAIIMDKVSSDPTLKLMLQQAAYVLPATAHRGVLGLNTSNQLLIPGNKNFYTGLSASRMGYTSKAKYAVASELDYNGHRLIAIVLNANGTQWTDSTKLLNFAKVASVEVGNTGTIYNTSLNVASNVSAEALAGANYITSIVNFASATGFTPPVAQNTAINQVPANNIAANNFVASSVVTNNINNTAFGSLPDTQGIWQRDNKGWYFIKANGQSANNEWIKQNGKIYCVDSTGYMITGWRQMTNGNMYYFDPTQGELRHGTWVNVSTGAYYLQDDGTLAKAPAGQTKQITTSVGTYTIDENGKAIAKIS